MAFVDGKKAPIYEAYTVLRGVVVGQGRHTIVMRYRPLSVQAGGVATLSAFIGAMVLGFWFRKGRVADGSALTHR